MNGLLKGAIIALTAVLFVVVLTPLHILFGWVAGHIIKLVCGQFVADGLNVLFGTARFTPDVLPLLGGTLGFIGGFFKSTHQTKSNSQT